MSRTPLLRELPGCGPHPVPGAPRIAVLLAVLLALALADPLAAQAAGGEAMVSVGVGKPQGGGAAAAPVAPAPVPAPADPLASWDTPREVTVRTTPDGVEYVDGELLLVLDRWESADTVRAAIEQHGGRVIGAIPRLAAMKVLLPEGREPLAEREAYGALVGVQWAQLDHVGHVSSNPVSPPNDTYYSKQWHLENAGQGGGTMGADIDAPGAWKIQRGSPNIVAAVLDIGMKSDHAEFEERIVDGYDFVQQDNDPAGAPHGTYVSGLLGARTGNGFGVSGVDQRCLIMPLRVGIPITESKVAQALDYSTAMGVTICSMSFSYHGGPPPGLGNEALKLASDAGIVLVAAAGNNPTFGSAEHNWPAKSPRVIAIGATDKGDARAYWSSTGSTLDFAAPGVEVKTVVLDPMVDGFYSFGGTSAATPIASGIVALLLAENPTLTQDEVYELLKAGAEDQVGNPAEDTPGWDPYHGHGRLNAARSLQALCGCTGDEDFWGSPGVLAPGRVQMLTLNAGPAFAGATYWILGSLSGTEPPAVLGHLALPLVADRYLDVTLANPSALIRAGTGRLDAEGRARAALQLPASIPSVLLGTTLHHAYVLLQDGQPVYVSRAVPAEIAAVVAFGREG